MLVNLISSYLNKDELIKQLIQIYNHIGNKGILILLGVRITKSSKDDFPPNREKLVKEFNKKYNEKSKITIGARAVTKHADRNKKQNKFWSQVKGNEENRNVNSNILCLDIIANAIWISIFNLGSNCKIIEVRNKEGYGLRWDYTDYNSAYFKGVIEPQIVSSSLNLTKKHSKNSNNSNNSKKKSGSKSRRSSSNEDE